MAKNIEHVVVLMLENRSFDHAIGFLKSTTYPIDGLTGTESNTDSQGVDVIVSQDAKYGGDLTADPAHDFLGVNEQIFGNSQGTDNGSYMTGFVRNYQSKTHDIIKSHNVMKCFRPSRLPALTTLAQEYAVCDQWFASVPGPTIPNRAFIFGATSLGHVDQVPTYPNLRTIFELLTEHNIASRIYYFDWSLGLLVKHIIQNSGRYLRPFDDFVSDCKNGSLPAYSFIEPRYNDFSSPGEFHPASDQHPDHDVFEGDLLIRQVYEAVSSNRQTWESTILVITYDEHGGLFDHVKPPDTVSPGDGKDSAVPPFNFKRLGVRVPAVIVSPWIPRKTIVNSKVFDHTSVIATIRKLFVANSENHFLTQRDLHANVFDDCLTLPVPRTDKVVFPKPLARKKALISQKKGKLKMGSATLSDLQQAMILHAASLENNLPTRRQMGTPISAIDNDQKVAEYLFAVQERVLRKKSRGTVRPSKGTANIPKSANPLKLRTSKRSKRHK